ncbi:carbon storage regulator CsrA [Pseudomonas phytophila]|uniref:Translational regulator CsrA n=1 Tax=Pseudomonas phytophila TaxID=2867264 RepID=A0ABY6FJI7_9PSED|nr:carbon storage regulator CsrA [Pseudomonas phytophila]MCQ2998007.1 carbon storage regulator CsrA [Pseudomonas syringae]MDG6403142.1 carbon storage regulator CsrA [Pseudomonas quasicaspiana]MCQ3003218.1 carbon storage regulator CsrA [Pseudomonas syringae]MCQ3032164.1 carbon storage regulator CsrA [Pseudomonas syringae]UXZ97994.1 carbon storage regulator CsrA [Pseudomonas phytophila]
MLVIMRDAGEVFSIGDDITIHILAIHGNQIRLGVEAPRHVKVHRAEVYKRIAQRLSQQAAKATRAVPDAKS